MKLSRIRIEQFKQFRESLEFDNLEPGINLFTGANEAGKSTIVAAIRAAFFERHRSGSVDELRPWGDAAASPTVELNFSVAGQAYRLGKSFLGRKRCELQIGVRRLDGAEAEDHLAELLGFRYAGRGASGAEHWGIPGLLWIEQGAAQELRESVTHATDHLRSALNASLGEVSSSGGDAVLTTVEMARNELLTPAAGSPRGAYADALKRETALAQAMQSQEKEILAYRQKVDTLASLSREHALDETAKPWTAFREQQHAAVAKLEAIQRIEETLVAERLRAGQIEERIALLRRQLDTFTDQEKAVETRRVALESSREALANADVLVAEWRSRREAAAARHEKARETLRWARQQEVRHGLNRQREEARRKTESTAATLQEAEVEQAALLELRRQAAASEIRPEDLESLREQDRQIRELQIRQGAAATRLRFTLIEDRNIQVGTESLTGSGERLLAEATPVILPGLGTLEIVPGGTDLAELRSRDIELKDRQADLLQRLGVPSLAAAEARHLEHARCVADIKTAEATLKALAPQGVDALRTGFTALQARAKDIEQALSQLTPMLEPQVPLPPVSEAEAAEASAANSLAAINDSLHKAELASGRARATLEAAVRELATALAVLEAPERAKRLAAANHDLVDARAEQAALANRTETLSRQVAEARPEIVRQDVERFRLSAEQHEKRHSERRDTLMRLEVELQAAGAQGLDERRAELARDLAQAQRRVEELRRHARALDYLLALLKDKRRTLTRKLQAPLQKHLNRYLQLLFPQASLEIDENLSPGPLTRTAAGGAETDAFDGLSFGAREQMGVITRLAYADLLRDAGRPTLIILDDALVHSDEARLAQMKRVLFDAATRHQVLLFTCHPEKWRDLGVAPKSLEAIRAGA